MSDPMRVLVLGASGLVGQQVLAQAVGRPEIRLAAVARAEVPLPAGARMEVHVAPVAGWEQEIAAIAPVHVVCTLGTTIARQGGNRQAFAAIDRDLVLDCARMALAAGARSLAVVSSVGADRFSRAFYLRVKGEMEAGLAELGYARLDILQPGLLRGKRRGDTRPLEALGAVLAPLLDLALHGTRRRYRSVRADDAAAAALQCALERTPGRFVHQHDAILRLARRWRGG